MAISIPRWTGMLRRAGAPARAATEIATEVDQTVDGLVAQHEYDSAFDRLLYTMQLGFEQVDAHFQQMDARFRQVEAHFQQVDARFRQVDARFEQVDARFEQVDARMDTMEARLEASLSKQLLIAVGIVLTGLAIATAIIVALFIQYAG